MAPHGALLGAGSPGRDQRSWLRPILEVLKSMCDTRHRLRWVLGCAVALLTPSSEALAQGVARYRHVLFNDVVDTSSSRCFGVNNYRMVAGTFTDHQAGNETRAFVWYVDSAYVELIDLPISSTREISDSGHVVGQLYGEGGFVYNAFT